jgi:hypothetical protein
MPVMVGEPLPKELHVSLPNNESFFKEHPFRFNGEYTVLDIEAFTLTNLLTNGLSAKLPFITDTGKTGSIQVNFKKTVSVPVPEYDTPIVYVRTCSFDTDTFLTLHIRHNTAKIMPRIQIYVEWAWKLKTDNSLYIFNYSDYTEATKIIDTTSPLYINEASSGYENGMIVDYNTNSYNCGRIYSVSYPTDINTFVPGFLNLRAIIRMNISDKPLIWSETERYNSPYGLVANIQL